MKAKQSTVGLELPHNSDGVSAIYPEPSGMAQMSCVVRVASRNTHTVSRGEHETLQHYIERLEVLVAAMQAHLEHVKRYETSDEKLTRLFGPYPEGTDAFESGRSDRDRSAAWPTYFAAPVLFRGVEE